MAGEAEMTNFANDTDRLIQHNEEHSCEQQVIGPDQQYVAIRLIES